MSHVAPLDPHAPEASPGAGLVVDAVEVRYGDVVAVHDTGFTVPSGRTLAVTGASGAGKTSLLRAVAGSLRPAAGSVRLDGEVVGDRPTSARRGVALVPQGNALSSSLSAHENVVVPLVMIGVAAGEARSRADAALRAVGLEEWAGHLVDELSGGQQQRVAVARALAAHARLLVCDEPTSELDGGNRARVMTALREAAAGGAVVLLATHDPATADEADAEVALDDGRFRWVRGFGGRHLSPEA